MIFESLLTLRPSLVFELYNHIFIYVVINLIPQTERLGFENKYSLFLNNSVVPYQILRGRGIIVSIEFVRLFHSFSASKIKILLSSAQNSFYIIDSYCVFRIILT